MACLMKWFKRRSIKILSFIPKVRSVIQNIIKDFTSSVMTVSSGQLFERILHFPTFDVDKYCIGQDGAYGQIKVIENRFSQDNIEGDETIVFAKWSGGCSMSQAANDQGEMHKCLHTLFKSSSFRYGEIAEPFGRAWFSIKFVLQQHLVKILALAAKIVS